MKRAALFGFVLGSLLLPADPSTYTPPDFADPERRARIESVLPRLDQIYLEYATNKHLPGMIYGVVLDGKLIHHLAWGKATLVPERPVEADTRFRIASMSKSFTALAILRLRDTRRLSLENPVEKYIPQFRNVRPLTSDSPPITVRHLLKMTAGFPQDDPWGDRKLADTVKELEELVAGGLAFSNPPGTTWEYSNLGYALLGEIVTRVSGRPYQDYITRSILRPLGMTNTVWEYAQVPAGKMAQGYRWENDQWQAEPLLHDGSFGAMGGLITTLDDFARYVAFHLDAWPPRDGTDISVVRRATRREMHRPAEVLSLIMDNPTLDGTTNPRVAGYSFGLSWNTDARGVIWLRHGGGLPGFGSEHRFLPEHGIGLIAFANLTYAPMTGINAQAMELLVTAAKIPARLPVAPPILRQRAEQVADILRTWNPEVMSDALAPNFFLDRSKADWKAYADELLGRCGTLRSVTELKPANQLRGRFEFVGELGNLEVALTLMPENPPRIQEVKLRFIPTSGAPNAHRP